MVKRHLSVTDIFLILANLIPLFGVWFGGWSAAEIFMVYCLETVLIGLFTIVRMAITATVKKTDLWNNTDRVKTNMPSWFFIIFFIVHYGFFVVIQLSIFLEVSGIKKSLGIQNAFDFLVNFQNYFSNASLILLLIFAVAYGLILVKDFIFNGAYRSASMGVLMFQPYGRIFVQQFTVIAGSLFLGFGAGKIFITIFVAIKIFFDVFVNYDLIMKQVGEKAKS
jgi:hypothetical protein